MTALGRAATADDALVWLHGRRLGIVGDGLSGDPSALVLDGKVIASNRISTGPFFVKAITAIAAGPVTLTGVQPGDTVVSVTDLSTPGDASSKFETVITVANQIQQTAASTDVMLVCVCPRS